MGDVHQDEAVLNDVLFYEFVEGGVRGEAGRVVDLE